MSTMQRQRHLDAAANAGAAPERRRANAPTYTVIKVAAFSTSCVPPWRKTMDTWANFRQGCFIEVKGADNGLFVFIRNT